MNKKGYRVYEHIFPNGKRYIGYTSRQLKDRFQKDGKGYQTQPLMWNAIQKYGWDNIIHNQIGLFQSEEYAKKFETECIRKYKTSNPEYGYNIIECDSDRTNREISYRGDSLFCINSRAYRKLRSIDCIENYSLFDKRANSSYMGLNCDSTFLEFMNREIGAPDVYHRFITGQFSGLIYASIYIDERLHTVTEEEYNRRKDDKMFLKFLCYTYAFSKKDICWNTVQQEHVEIQNDPTVIIYSLLDGTYFIQGEKEIRDIYPDKIVKLLELLNDEYELHRRIKYYFYETQKYLCSDDNYTIRQFGKNITRLSRELMKCNGIAK